MTPSEELGIFLALRGSIDYDDELTNTILLTLAQEDLEAVRPRIAEIERNAEARGKLAGMLEILAGQASQRLSGVKS
jgi:hypothetical protein